MWTRLYAPCRQNAVWLINQDVEAQLMQMAMAVGTGGVPVYMPAGGASQSPFGTLFGRPVVPIEQCSALGDVGDIVFADLPKVGAEVSAGQSCGEIESTKSVSEIFAPVSGIVAQANSAVETSPDTLNADPYENGWIADVTVTDAQSAIASLLDSAGYKAFIGE
jgi:glycine cleavage system H protein